MRNYYFCVAGCLNGNCSWYYAQCLHQYLWYTCMPCLTHCCSIYISQYSKCSTFDIILTLKMFICTCMTYTVHAVHFTDRSIHVLRASTHSTCNVHYHSMSYICAHVSTYIFNILYTLMLQVSHFILSQLVWLIKSLFGQPSLYTAHCLLLLLSLQELISSVLPTDLLTLWQVHTQTYTVTA